MKKSHILILSILSSTFLIFGCSKKAESTRSKEVVVYTYDSFISEWGPGPKLAQLFQEKTGYTVEFVDCGDGVQILSRALLERKDTQADILLGLDNNTAEDALKSDILEAYLPKDAESVIDSELIALLDPQHKLIPYDYSHFALIYDTRSSVPEPHSLLDLTKGVYKKKIILMDPRTSTPGLGFVAWTRAIFGDAQSKVSFDDYWEALKPNILTMAPGWSAGYGLFTNGEAPLVISYTTSPAANLEYDGIDYYKALVFDEGHYMQIEGAGILKDAPNKKLAKLFMDFLISEEAQSELPLTQWMYPANKNVVLPPSYAKAAATPRKTVTTDVSTLYVATDTAMAIIAQ